MEGDTVFMIVWSRLEKGYIATCSDYESLSFIDPDPEAALAGLMRIIDDIEEDDE